MAFGGLLKDSAEGDNAEINMIPLIDVMLVLVVIFIITAPFLTHTVKLDLPVAVSQSITLEAETVHLSIDAAGLTYWNNDPLTDAERKARMHSAAQQSPQPEIHLRADAKVAYQHVASVMSDAAQAGLTKIGFVTDPRVPE